MKASKLLLICFIVLSAAFIIWLCATPRGYEQKTVRVEWPVMGTQASITIDKKNCATATVIAKTALSEVNAELSAFVNSSHVSLLNLNAGNGMAFYVGNHMVTILQKSKAYHEASEGAFNPLAGTLVELWGFFRGGNANTNLPPDQGLIDYAISLSDINGLEITNNSARLVNENMRLDFGAIAKSYGVDVVYERLAQAGFNNYMVNLGGNIRCAGMPDSRRTSWKIAIRDPSKGIGGDNIGTLLLTNGMAVATSGNYEQFIVIDGKRYTHIIDPRTGWPVSNITQVTVVAKDAAEADALSTACFVLGSKKGGELISKYPSAGAMFVSYDSNGEMIIEMAGSFIEYYSKVIEGY